MNVGSKIVVESSCFQNSPLLPHRLSKKCPNFLCKKNLSIFPRKYLLNVETPANVVIDFRNFIAFILTLGFIRHR